MSPPQSLTQKVVQPIARHIAGNTTPLAVGLVGALAIVGVLAVAGILLLGAAGLVFGLFLGLTAVLGLGVVAYALGAAGPVDLLRRTGRQAR